MQRQAKRKVKLIQVDDTFTDNKFEYPYFQCVHTTIRFIVRSKHTYSYEPVILIQNDKAFRPLLPINTDISMESIKQNFVERRGIFTQDGAWISQLDCAQAGLINFQLVFMDRKRDHAIVRTGACDTIVVMQNKVDVRFLRKMTVFPRCIGHHTKWVDFFRKQCQLGYNSFHLAPIQQTGMSKSYYSICDQLDLTSDVFEGSPEQKMMQLTAILKEMNKCGVIFFVDIVLNHTSFDSEWIKQKPQCVYTCQNTPHLNSAFLVDKVIYEWGNQIKNKSLSQNKMTEIQFNCHKQNLWKLMKQLKIEQFFQISPDITGQFESVVAPTKPSQNLFAKDPIQVIEDFIIQNTACIGCTRYGIKVNNISTEWKQLNLPYEKNDLIKGIESFNKRWKRKIQNQWMPQIINNVMGEVRHNYLQNQYRSYKDHYPFVTKYFTQIVSPKAKNFFAINNGWVSGADTSQANFIYSRQFYYLRRRVNVWGDLVRIRYGQNISDAPYSWSMMEKYVCSMAKIFDGFRMDNLHGTQLHVARYMIKKARQVNPSLILFGQLFTDTQQERAMFVRAIGINSTLKQAQYMLTGESFINNFHSVLSSQRPYIGSINPYFETQTEIIKYCRRKQPIVLIYDLTHDNETYYKKNILRRQLPISMVISLMGTFIGSTKGYDQYYWKHISVIEQSPLYSQDKQIPIIIDQLELVKKKIITSKKNVVVYGSWNNWKEPMQLKYDAASNSSWADIQLPLGKYEYKFKCEDKWIVNENYPINERLNNQFELHSKTVKTTHANLEGFRKAAAKYSQDYKSYRKYFAYNDGDIVIMFRETTNYEDSITIIVNLGDNSASLKEPIVLPGKYQSCEVWYQTDYAAIKGIYTEVEIIQHQNLYEYFEVSSSNKFGKDSLISCIIPPGFACIVKSKKDKELIENIRKIQSISKKPLVLPPLSALDINLLLFGIARQQEVRFGQSNYVVSQCKQLVYGGFSGILKIIHQAKRYNTLASPLFDNLRQGSWLLHYYVDRIRRYKNLNNVADIIDNYFQLLEKIPSDLQPSYFTDFIYQFQQVITNQITNSKNLFERKLIVACNQFISNFPNEKPGFQTLIAAGLPHFATGWSRSWGRDAFISNQLLLTQPAIYRQVIIQFASVLRHGTIPNLLDSGNNPRYNCRDACWWFIRGVKEYAIQTGDYQIFNTKVNMVFLSNDLLDHNRRKQKGQIKVMRVEEVIQEIFESHAKGISYREWHAGYQIDSNMSTDGFTINLNADEYTGFIVGGNSYNCLTWMDKMGSSLKAGTKGLPSTPRSGAPVQLVGLLKHCLSSYHKLYKQGKYSYNQVIFKSKKVTFEEWANQIQQNFEQKFYIHHDSLGNSPKNHHAKIKGIYKDVVMSQMHQEEYRLRPNALIALALAPQLFNETHALNYLANVKSFLVHQKSIGISTLAQFHQSIYAPYYDNDDDSDIVRLAHGYSYHNGPQWVWLYGFYIQAIINFRHDKITKSKAMSLLQNHIIYMNNDEWCSLPQLTNKNGDANSFSCDAQAWSISSLLMAVKSINKLKQ